MGRHAKDYSQDTRPGGRVLGPTGQPYEWEILCDCGVRHVSRAMHNRKTLSCRSCVYRGGTARTHGKTGSAEYKRWSDMKNRCYNPSVRSYKDYGGRGIKVYEGWKSDFAAYLKYVQTELGEAPSPSHTIDRKNNDGNYEPGNLRWASKFEQTHNRRI